jgi:hypothetical protein
MTSKPFKIQLLFSYVVCFLGIISCKSDVKNVQKVGQKMATFYAEPIHDSNKESYNRKMEAQWLIRGQKLTYGSEAISIVPEKSRLDTIFFKEDNYWKWDTIICSIQSADSIVFKHNDCCDDCYVLNKTLDKTLRSGRSIAPKIVFNIKSSSNKYYLGDCTGASVLAKFNIKDTLKHACPLSAMFSNVYRITLSEIKLSNKGAKGSISADCFYTKDKRTDGKFHYKKTELSALWYKGIFQ